MKWRENDLFLDIFLLAKASEFSDFLRIDVEDLSATFSPSNVLECKAEEAPARHSNFAFNLPSHSKALITQIQLRSLPLTVDVIFHNSSSSNIFDSVCDIDSTLRWFLSVLERLKNQIYCIDQYIPVPDQPSSC